MLGVCLALGYVVQDELGRGIELAPVALDAAPPEKIAQAPKPAAPRATPIKAFSETLARPLFHASRKPAPKLATATPEAAAVGSPVLKLVGVVIGPRSEAPWFECRARRSWSKCRSANASTAGAWRRSRPTASY